jgi:hypothetical protein
MAIIDINIPIEDAVTDGSLNPVTSNAVFDGLTLKANSADLATVATSGDYNDLDNLPVIPAAQVNSDWNATSGVTEILNKPTIPSVTNFVPYTGATNDVDLGVHDLTATQGTFATSGNPDTLTVSHSSGSGKALTITKGGNGEGVYVNKTSGSGNAVTVIGDLEATNLKRTGGTSAQFLKANGSIDSTSYQPTLVSGTNIKTINGNSLLGSGDLVISGGGGAIAVGTTAVTSGTVGRVFFQGTGDVVQQSGSLFWDNTNSRLGIGTASPTSSIDTTGNITTNGAAGTSSFGTGQIIANSLGNSIGSGFYSQVGTGTGTYGGFGVGYGTTIKWLLGISKNITDTTALSFLEDGLSASRRLTIATGGNVGIGASVPLSKLHTFSTNQLAQMTLGSTSGVGLTVSNTDNYYGLNFGTAVSGDGWIQQGTTTGGATSYNLSLQASGGRVGIGAISPQARLDVRAQGALSTDIAFRVRNSADTQNLVDSAGNGSFFLRANTGDMHFNFDPANSRIHLKRTGIYSITTDNAVTALELSCNVGNSALIAGSNRFNIINGGNFHFEETSGVLSTSGAGAIVMKNRTAPSTNVQDRFYLYSADIVAGNAAPHFRTENGNIIKLYQQSSAGILTVPQLVTVLQNLGLLS